MIILYYSILQLNGIECFSANKINAILAIVMSDVYTKKSNPEDLYNVVIFDNCKFPDKIISNILLITMTRKKLRGHI